MPSKRAVRWTVAIVTIVVVAGALSVAAPYLAVGIAYKAKLLCSEVFVAGRNADDVVNELAIDDLRALRVLHADVNRADSTTRASFLSFGERRARFRSGRGCTLESDEPLARVTALEPFDVLADSLDAAPTMSRPRLETALDRAFGEPDASQPRRTRAIVVLQHGRLVAERYAAGFGPDTPLQGWSMTKSVLNALVGVAVGRGALVVNAPAGPAAWTDSTDPRRRITVNDMLHMSTGLAFDEDQASPSSDVLRMLFASPDMASFAASKPLRANPGATWKYSTATSMLVSRVLRDALGDSTYFRFPRDALFGPLGMRHAVMETDAAGTFVASSYMYATAREWARVGQLYLQDGVWNGRRILPEGWVAYTRTAAPASNGIYGAHFWLATPAEYRGPAAGLPSDVFHAVGHEGQFITIVPSRGVVIVRLGRTRHASAWSHDQFVASILDAL